MSIFTRQRDVIQMKELFSGNIPNPYNLLFKSPLTHAEVQTIHAIIDVYGKIDRNQQYKAVLRCQYV